MKTLSFLGLFLFVTFALALNVDFYIAVAEEAYNSGEYGKAIEKCNKVLEAEPQNVQCTSIVKKVKDKQQELAKKRESDDKARVLQREQATKAKHEKEITDMNEAFKEAQKLKISGNWTEYELKLRNLKEKGFKQVGFLEEYELARKEAAVKNLENSISNNYFDSAEKTLAALSKDYPQDKPRWDKYSKELEKQKGSYVANEVKKEICQYDNAIIFNKKTIADEKKVGNQTGYNRPDIIVKAQRDINFFEEDIVRQKEKYQKITGKKFDMGNCKTE